MAKGQKYPLSVISQHLMSYRSSNETASAYCRRNKIPTTTFHSWQKRHPKSAFSDFIEVDILQPTSSEKIAINHGEFSLEIPQNFSERQLTSILSCMKKALNVSTSAE